MCSSYIRCSVSKILFCVVRNSAFCCRGVFLRKNHKLMDISWMCNLVACVILVITCDVNQDKILSCNVVVWISWEFYKRSVNADSISLEFVLNFSCYYFIAVVFLVQNHRNRWQSNYLCIMWLVVSKRFFTRLIFSVNSYRSEVFFNAVEFLHVQFWLFKISFSVNDRCLLNILDAVFLTVEIQHCNFA